MGMGDGGRGDSQESRGQSHAAALRVEPEHGFDVHVVDAILLRGAPPHNMLNLSNGVGHPYAARPDSPKYRLNQPPLALVVHLRIQVRYRKCAPVRIYPRRDDESPVSLPGFPESVKLSLQSTPQEWGRVW